MCRPGRAVQYSPRTKCCTFLPQLTNFAVGIAIRDRPERIEPSPRHRRTPLGMIAAPGEQQRYEAMVARDGFGRELGLRCPFYAEASGRCTIWAAREAQCGTWFCAHDHGPRGRAMWQAALELLRTVEAALARWCVAEAGLDLRRAGEDDAGAWATWWGREAEFYLGCLAVVDALDAAELRRLLPPGHAAQRDALLRAHAELSP